MREESKADHPAHILAPRPRIHAGGLQLLEDLPEVVAGGAGRGRVPSTGGVLEAEPHRLAQEGHGPVGVGPGDSWRWASLNRPSFRASGTHREMKQPRRSCRRPARTRSGRVRRRRPRLSRGRRGQGTPPPPGRGGCCTSRAKALFCRVDLEGGQVVRTGLFQELLRGRVVPLVDSQAGPVSPARGQIAAIVGQVGMVVGEPLEVVARGAVRLLGLLGLARRRSRSPRSKWTSASEAAVLGLAGGSRSRVSAEPPGRRGHASVRVARPARLAQQVAEGLCMWASWWRYSGTPGSRRPSGLHGRGRPGARSSASRSRPVCCSRMTQVVLTSWPDRWRARAAGEFGDQFLLQGDGRAVGLLALARPVHQAQHDPQVVVSLGQFAAVLAAPWGIRRRAAARMPMAAFSASHRPGARAPGLHEAGAEVVVARGQAAAVERLPGELA